MKSYKFPLHIVLLVLLAILGAGMVFHFHLSSKKVPTMDDRLVEVPTMDDRLVDLFKTYVAYDQDGPLKMSRYGRDNDGGYVVPEKAMNMAELLLGYGILDDNSFEDDFSLRHNKKSYGFDCAIRGISSKSHLFTFVPECISTNKNVYGNDQDINNLNNVYSFKEQIEKLGLLNKKIFIKMDIETAEYLAFDDILPFSENITGIALEVHMMTPENRLQAIELLQKLNKDFVLLHVHGNNASPLRLKNHNVKGKISGHLELSYINKNLVMGYQLSEKQIVPSSRLDMPCFPNMREVEFEIIS